MRRLATLLTQEEVETLPWDDPPMMPGNAAPDIVVPFTGQAQRARSGDFSRTVHLGNQLPGEDLFAIWSWAACSTRSWPLPLA